MVNNCAACTKSIRSNIANIKCFKCSSCYHLMCVNISDRKLSEEFKANWTCPMCQSKEPKRDNSDTPVRLTAAPSSTCLSVEIPTVPFTTLREGVGGCRKSPTTAQTSPTVLTASDMSPSADSSLTEQIKLLRGDIGEIKGHIISLTDLIKNCCARVEEHEKRLIETESKIRLIEKQQSELSQCRSTIAGLQQELESRAQAGLRNEIEISGVKEHTDESPLHIIQVISSKIGLQLTSADIDYVTRVGKRTRFTQSQAHSDSIKESSPRPLVVRFTRRHDRDAFLRAGKSRRNLTSADIDVGGAAQTIFINERLTQYNRQLFRTARKESKSAAYKYCWTKNGTIYVRKQEGNPAIVIKNMDDLQRQFQLPVLAE